MFYKIYIITMSVGTRTYNYPYQKSSDINVNIFFENLFAFAYYIFIRAQK